MIDRHLVARRLRRYYLRHRRILASLLAGLVAFLGIRVATPPAPDTEPVAVAASDLSGGAALQAGDIRIARMPSALVAGGSYSSASAVVGRVLAGPMRAGEPLTDRRLLGRSLLAGYGKGLVAAPVPVPDPAVLELLHIGDVLDVYAATSAERPATLLAADVPVLTLPPTSADTQQAAFVVLAVSPAQAADLASASAVAPLWITLRG